MRRRSDPWLTRAACVAIALAVTITGAPASAAPAAPSDASSETTAGAASGSGGASGKNDTGETSDASSASEAPATDEPSGAAPEVESQPPPSTVAGMGASVISSNNPEARRARADLEGTALATSDSGVPERMRPLQRGAWWSVFGTFALATTGGLFAGFAEVEEDRARRLGSTLDTMTGSQPMYADVQAEYEEILAKGERQAWIARGFLIGAGVTAIAAIALFAADARRQRARSTALRRGLRLGGRGLEVRF